MNESIVLSDPEIRRYSGQIALAPIGLTGQEKLKTAKVAIVGAGGLGTVVMQYLASIGIGHMGIIDYSLVDELNIQRQTLYGGNDLGKLKTIISKQHLQNIFPLIEFDIINIQLNSSNLEKILTPFQLVVNATNDTVSQELIGKTCIKHRLPCIYGMVQGFRGEVGVFKNTVRESLFQNENETMYHKGNISLAYGLIGNLMAFEAFKVLLGDGTALVDQRLVIDLLSYHISVS